MKHNPNVPAFLSKLWTLVEDADTNEFISWSQEGHSFLVLDEQHFAKEILPKFFKHNNMASFIRQLNMYGFRKVMHIDTGIVKQEKDGPVEFQHPYFQQGQDNLLENIKRKVSNTRPEDNKIRQEDLSQILASVHSVHSKQESIDMRLATLKRENEALWREISDLRQIHAHQQQLIKKLIHFIITLVQNNRILNLKRKRPVLMNSNGKKPKYIHQIYDDKACVDQSPVNSQSGVKGSDLSDDVIVCDLTESDGEVGEGSPRSHEQGDIDTVEVELDSCAFLPAETDVSTEDIRQAETGGSSSGATSSSSRGATGGSSSGATGGAAGSSSSRGATSSGSGAAGSSSGGATGGSSSGATGGAAGSSSSRGVTSGGSSRGATSGRSGSSCSGAAGSSSSSSSRGATSSALQLNKALSLEDPVKMMDSILNESGAISQNINLLGKMELMDYLDSIDCSLEDFQAMLYGKQFGMDFDGFEEGSSSKENTAQLNRGRTEDVSTDKQLIQYTSCPLLAILDSCMTQPDLDLGPSSSSGSFTPQLQPSSCYGPVEAEPPTELLDSGPEPKQTTRSSLVRLEPLTEAEASAESLFYLCDLSPAEGDAAGLDGV